MTTMVIYLGPDSGYEATKRVIGDMANVLKIEPELEKVTPLLPDAVAILDASMKVKFSDELLSTANQLKIISCATTGSDHISRSIIDERGISIRTLKEDKQLLQGLTPAAELSWTLLMACARKLIPATQHVLDGKWSRECFPGIMLKGKQLGLIGCGRIGGWMARYGKAFGMKVVGYDPFIEDFPDGVESCPLEKLFECSDFVSIHVHLSPETNGLICKELLERIKPGAIFVNTSRGAIVDEKALVEALLEKRIYAAGVDVLEGEPDIERHPLLEYARKYDNLIITPHCGGNSPDAVAIVCARAAEKICEAIA